MSTILVVLHSRFNIPSARFIGQNKGNINRRFESLFLAGPAAANAASTFQVLTSFEICRRIVEHEQKGEKRAGYGQELLKVLGARLTVEFGGGISRANLEYMRRVYLEWRDCGLRISQALSEKLDKTPSVRSSG